MEPIELIEEYIRKKENGQIETILQVYEEFLTYLYWVKRLFTQ